MTSLLDTSKVIVGASGSGKTVTAKAEVEQLLAQRRHVLILDPTGVWWGMRSDPAGTGPGFDLPIFGGEHGDLAIKADQGAAIARIVVEQRVSAIVDLSGIDNSRDWRRFARDLVAELRRKPRGNFHFVVDEADEFAAERPADDVAFELRENMVWLAKRGRASGFVPTFITQRTADIAKAVISQAQTIVAHQLIAPADRKAIDDYLKGHGTAEARAEVMGSLAELAVGERWIYSPRLKVLERGTTPALTTFDSSRTPAPGEQLAQPRGLAELDVSAIAAALAPLEPEEPDVEPADELAVRTRLAVDADRITALEQEVASLKRLGDLLYNRGIVVGIGRAREAVEALTIPAARSTEKPPLDAETIAALSPDQIFETTPAGTTADVEAPPAAGPCVPPTAGGADRPAPAQTGAVTPAQQRILDQLAWAADAFHRPAVERQVLAIVVGTHPRTKGYLNNLGALRSAGLIDYPTGSTVALTAAGVDQAARPDIAGVTLATLRDRVAAWLPPAQRKLFKLVAAQFPRAFDRDRLAAAVGQHPRTKSLLNNIGRLKTLGLLTSPNAATLRAAPYLFGKDR